MSKKAVGLPALADVYHNAMDTSLALWPVFFIRIGFLLLNFLMIGLFLFIGFWPILHSLYEHFDDLTSGQFGTVFEDMHLMSYFTDWHVLIVTAFLVAFYITFISFFFAFFDGALYSQMNRYRKEGETFQVVQFFSEGFKFTLPMMGLQAAWVSLFLGVLAGLTAMAVSSIFLFKFLIVLGFLMAFPMAILGIFAVIFWFTAAMISGAYLVDGYSVWDSVRESIRKVWAHRARAMWATLLITLVYIVFYMAFNVVFEVFGMIPLIGLLFLMFKAVVNTVLTIGFNIYMTALAVILQLEPKEVK
jgi:hypothetical protein